jgi:K+-transporting ATPase ATPase C chain
MKKELLSSIVLTVLCILLFSVVYPGAVWVAAQIGIGRRNGVVVNSNSKQYYSNIAQRFTEDIYFWSRPSAVDYNAAGSGGSNKGPDNPDYLVSVQQRIDTFLAHNPGISKAQIPSDLVTASGSGLDPHISVQGAVVQALRISKARNIAATEIISMIEKHTEKPLFGLFGPEKVNVLQLNIELDKFTK